MEKRRGDLNQMFKLVKGTDDINLHNPIQYLNENGRTRGRNLKIHRQLVNTLNNCKLNTITDSFFTNRVVKDWNSLTQETVNSISINQF